MAETVRALSSFTLPEQRLIQALVEAADAPPWAPGDAIASIKDLVREAAREATVAALRDRDARRALPTTRRASPLRLH